MCIINKKAKKKKKGLPYPFKFIWKPFKYVPKFSFLLTYTYMRHIIKFLIFCKAGFSLHLRVLCFPKAPGKP
jgi:hypothetical protein